MRKNSRRFPSALWEGISSKLSKGPEADQAKRDGTRKKMRALFHQVVDNGNSYMEEKLQQIGTLPEPVSYTKYAPRWLIQRMRYVFYGTAMDCILSSA